MLDKNNEVFFEEYCKTCKYKNYSETDSPCAECIAEPVNLYSHKPVKWEGADGIFSGPPPRPDHAYQRAVKYIPEKRKDKEKAIARLNIDAEYTGNKVQSISEDATDDQYPSATAVKKALEGQNEVNAQALAKKIDAPSGCKSGEFLAVEEVDEEGVVKKVKTAEVQTDPPDWNENDSTKPGYIKNRPFYSNENLLLSWTHDASNESYVSDTDVTLISGHTYIVSIDNEEYVAIAKTLQTGRYSYSVCIGNYISSILPFNIKVSCDDIDDTDGFGKLTAFEVAADTGAEIKIYEADIHTIGEKYFPDTIFSQKNAPIRFGDGTLSAIQGKDTTASGDYSHAEGFNTTASGDYSHAEGAWTKTSTYYSHAEGSSTTASGNSSHAEGSSTTASGNGSHAEGSYTTASGNYSHAEGYFTVASNLYQSVSGKYNKYNLELPQYAIGEYIRIVGNGTSDTERSNAHTLDWDGNAWFAGNVYVGSTSGTNKDDGSVRLATVDELSRCYRSIVIPTQGDDGTITYSSNVPALFVYYEVFGGNPTWNGNAVECCLLPIEDNGPLTVLNYTGMSIDQNSDGNTVLAVRFSSYVSGKHISAEIKDTVSGFQTDDEELISSVVTVTEKPVTIEVFSLPPDDSSSSAKGNDGLVPGPTLQERNQFLRGDGKWVDLLFCYGNWNEVYKDLKNGVIRSIFTIASYTNTQSGTPKTLGVLYYDGTNGPKLEYTMFGRDGVIYSIDFDRQYNTFSSTALTNKPLPTPTTAQVGQIVKVKAVDADGKITETETVDMPSDVVVVNITSTTDDDGNTTYSSDMTAFEICEQWSQGKVCIAKCPFEMGGFSLPVIFNLGTTNSDADAYANFYGFVSKYAVLIRIETSISDGSSTNEIRMSKIAIGSGPTYVDLVESDDDPTVLNISNNSDLSIVSLSKLVQSGTEVKLVFNGRIYSLASDPHSASTTFSTIYPDTSGDIEKMIYSEIFIYSTGISGDGESITLTEKEL